MDQGFNDYHLKDYLKPHWKQFLIVILLILVVTGFNLLRPKILQVAIDDHIDVLDRPYVESVQGEIELHGNHFSRVEEGGDRRILSCADGERVLLDNRSE